MRRYDAAMQHSVVGRRDAWPARFPQPAAQRRGRRLGLRGRTGFVAAGARRVRPSTAPLRALSGPWGGGRVEPAAAEALARRGGISWTRPTRPGTARRPSVAPAWRG